MSKHLRFKSLLGALAIMLTLGMSWSSVSAQNVSSEKEVVSFTVAGQVGNTVIDNVNHTIDITVPFGTGTTLATDFAVSQFAQMYRDQQVAGAFVAADLMAPGDNIDYTDVVAGAGTMYVTVEAENHSFVYYLVTISTEAASTDADLLTVQLDYTQWYILCGYQSTAAKTAASPWAGGADVEFTTEANPNLDAVTLYFTTNGESATLNGVAITSGSAHDFDADNDGVAENQTLVITAQDGTTTKTYTLSHVRGISSIEDDLLTFTYDPATVGQPAGFTGLVSLVKDDATNVIDVVVNYWPGANLAQLIPTFEMSTYATAKSTMVWTGTEISAQADEVCSGVTAHGGATIQLYVFAEDRTEISTWTINITQAAARTGAELTSLTAMYDIGWGHATCLQSDTWGPITGTIAAGVVTFNVPFSVSSVDVSIVADNLSAGATAVPSTGALADGSTIVVTAEDGVTSNTYTVDLVQGTASSDNQLLTFGFKLADNTGTGLVANVAGTITGGLVTVMVPWDTDLYALTPCFTASTFSTVWIAESDMVTYTPQCSQVTTNDFSNSQTYVVRAEDGTEERWDVTVVKEAVKTGNALIDFMLVDLDMCIGPVVDVAGSYDGMNITVTVKNLTDVTALMPSFTISDGAMVTPAAGVADDFTSPVTYTVTAQNGDVATYTVTVVVRNDADVNDVAKINKYWFDGDDNGAFGADIMGEINETAKTIHVWVPWGTDVTNLVASFELENEPWVRMTRSEDLITSTELMQYSGVSSNDYTTPIAYTVYAEDCSTVEYFVTVFITPNTNTGISEFTFDMTGCICEQLVDGDMVSTLVNEIDVYAKRIHITLPYTMDLTDLAPNITIYPGASIKPAESEKQDWTNGPVTYVVTAPDGVTKTTWSVLVENPACQETDILSFALPEIQVNPDPLATDADGNLIGDYLNGDYHGNVVTYDYTNHTINVIIQKGAKLDKVYYERTISCGAEICCVSGNCVDNHYLDFSESLCHTCVVTAQDESITQEWTICLTEIDTDCPTVMTESVLAMNCEDTVYVTPSKLGEVFIIHEDAIACIDNYYPCNCGGIKEYDDDGNLISFTSNPLGDKDLISDFIAEKMLAKVTADTLAATAIPTQGLYSGVYYAFAIDTWGNVSCQSKQKLYIDICEKEVANLTDLRAANPAFMYTVTGEVLVSYEETITGGNLKYVQDADAGIEVRDLNAGCSAIYGVGTGLTGLKGMIMDVRHLSGNDPCSEETACSKVFVPICCYSPTVSSTGNVIAPIELTFSEFAAAPRAYDAMFVRINTPMMLFNDYGGAPQSFVYEADHVNADILAYTATGTGDYFISSVLNTNYIGESYPDVPKIYQGINTYFTWGGACYGTVTPRWVAEETGDPSDILDVGDCLLMADPTPVKIDGVVPETCSSLTDVDIVNEGGNEVTITALYLDDMSGQDEFELIYPTPVPFNLDHWGNADGNVYKETVQVKFCPKDPGAEEATLVVEYCDGTILEVPIMGTTVLIVDAPYFSNFNNDTEGSTDGWSATNLDLANTSYNFGVDGQVWRFAWSWGSFYGAVPAILESPGFRMADLQSPELKWWTGTYYGAQFRVDVSTDFKKTWTTVKDFGSFTNGNGTGKFMTVDLSAYEGTEDIVFIRWYGTGGSYWGIDNVSLDAKITFPIYEGNVETLDLGGVQLGESATSTYSIANIGASVLTIKKIELTGDAVFALTDANVYPFEIHDGSYAYTVDPSGDVLSVDVTYTPVEVGGQTAMLKITYGMYEDKVMEVPVVGEGLSCYTAAEAVLGDNWAASQNSWFTYTADVFQMTWITSCHPNQDVDYDAVYGYDTWLQLWDACDGNLIAENDDLNAACTYNRATSGLLLPMNAGETVKIFWPWMFDSEHDDEGFFFTISATYPIDGDVCETAIPLTLPVVNHFGSTVKFEDDYDMSPCSPYSNYMDGNDKVYSINLEYDGYLTGNILGAYGSIHVLDMCPKEELEKKNCKAFVGGPNGGEFTKRIAAGEYFVIISTWSPPQTVDFLLNMTFQGLGVDDNQLSNSLSVYPNPTNGQFTVSISNAEATDLTVELVNISGQVVYRNEVKAVYTYNEDIDASEFAKGVYYLKVNDGSEVKVEKVVIQ